MAQNGNERAAEIAEIIGPIEMNMTLLAASLMIHMIATTHVQVGGR